MLCSFCKQSFARKTGSTSEGGVSISRYFGGGVLNVCALHTFLRCCLGLEPAVFISIIHGPNGTSLTSTSYCTSSAAARLGCTGTARTVRTSSASRASKRQKLHSCVLRYCTSSGTPRCKSTASYHFRQHSIHKSPGSSFIW